MSRPIKPARISVMTAMDDRTDWGPYMMALNDRQRLFVLELAGQEKPNYSEAYRNAGYDATSPASLKVGAMKLAHNPKILEALEEVIVQRIKSAMPMALNALVQLADDPQSPQARLGAARDLLDRGGASAVKKIEARVTAEVITTDKGVMQRIRQLCEILQLPAERLIGHRAAEEIEDAEFVELPADPVLAEAAGSLEGLEGIL